MTTEHRTRPAVDEADRPATVNESSSGNRRTQRKCHSAEIIMLTNSPAVPERIKVVNMLWFAQEHNRVPPTCNECGRSHC
jgi:hypothetical protein